ncbi:hypothetical protein BN871_LH_00030 [Paenibacillus sp. P22]|nr:hypothetical protein BN871_LH_00030 [Paenibacillus sp. P22]
MDFRSWKCSPPGNTAGLGSRLAVVALRLGLMPLPSAGDDVLQIAALRIPSELRAGPLGRSDQHGGIAGSARLDDRRNLAARNPAGDLDDFLHGEAVSVAEIVDGAVRSLAQALDGEHMGVGKVADMDVIADAAAVCRRVIFSEYRDMAPLAQCCLEHDRNQMRLGIMILSDSPAFVSACGIEIPKGYEPESMRPVEPANHFFHRQLRFPIGIGRLRAVQLGDRHLLRLSISRSRAGEDDPAHAGAVHRFQQAQRSIDVVMVVFARVLHALPDQAARRKMNDRVDGVLAEYPVQQPGIPQISLVQLPAEHRLAMALLQVVDHDNLLAVFQQRRYCMRTDITGSSRYQYSHGSLSSRKARLICCLLNHTTYSAAWASGLGCWLSRAGSFIVRNDQTGASRRPAPPPIEQT